MVRRRRGSRPASEVTLPFSYRLLLAAGLGLALAGCANHELDETGGMKVVRSTCPAVAIPAYTGDVTLFNPPQSRDASAFDVEATITNLLKSCDESQPTVHATVNFDVVARRADARAPRDLVLPYFSAVVRGGTRLISKQEGRVLLHFDAGQYRATGTAQAGAEINKAAASLPESVSARLNRKRRATDADATIDPMTDPRIRAAVNQANFELLIGFQLDHDQLVYNATR